MDPVAPQAEKTYPRVIGVLLALFIPGIAHWLSGAKKTGLILFGSLLAIPFSGLCLATIPNTAFIYTGLALLLLITPLLFIGMLIKSFRPIHRLSGKGWLRFVGILVLVYLTNISLRIVMPVTTYKIPTGAMQPTLMGIHTTPEQEDTSLMDYLLYGREAETYTASASGSISHARGTAAGLSFNIGDAKHHLPHYAIPKTPMRQYTQGDILWSGTVIQGDYILANKHAYLFKAPKRGDIVTFSTNGIDHPNVRPNTVYVKRIVGLPGETIGIKDGNLIVNGEPITEPTVFQTLEYGNEGQLSGAEQTITLGDEEYLPLGDNTNKHMSLDGRFYGSIHRDSIIAKVQTIYWPFNRIGPVE